jgi:hypothetical protein
MQYLSDVFSARYQNEDISGVCQSRNEAVFLSSCRHATGRTVDIHWANVVVVRGCIVSSMIDSRESPRRSFLSLAPDCPAASVYFVLCAPSEPRRIELREDRLPASGVATCASCETSNNRRAACDNTKCCDQHSAQHGHRSRATMGPASSHHHHEHTLYLPIVGGWTGQDWAPTKPQTRQAWSCEPRLAATLSPVRVEKDDRTNESSTSTIISLTLLPLV